MQNIALNHIHLLEQYSYIGIFTAVALAGHFVPVPEDISLITAGYLVAMGYAKLLPMLLVGMTAPVVGDGLLFYLAKTGSRFAPPPENYMKGKVLEFGTYQMRTHTFRTIFLMRFVTGFRFLSPLMAAYLGVPYKKYFLANALSAVFFGPFFIILGYLFHAQITSLIHTLNSIEHGLLAVIALLIIGSTVYYLKKRFKV